MYVNSLTSSCAEAVFGVTERPEAALGHSFICVPANNATATLVNFLDRGRPGRKEGTRELVVPSLPYFVVYRIWRAEVARHTNSPVLAVASHDASNGLAQSVVPKPLVL